MERIRVGDIEMRATSCQAAVVGAGAAGLNAADELKKGGADVLLIADSFSAGTSRNAGSDKQTYYKLSLSGAFEDSAPKLARAYFSGGSMHGDTAYALAAGSARAFLKLVELGVPFPQNALGEFVGYQTDHDDSLRATSAGPLTSRYMAEALLASVRARGVRELEGARLCAILKDAADRAAGLLLLDGQGPLFVAARHIVLASGGPAFAYGQTVYPESQSGATGAAIRSGAATNNLCYWQYGLASLHVRWNVSGSYQQAIPVYTDGSSPFLEPSFSDRGDMLDSVFLKGYQWPFDARKLTGSSRVDAAVSLLSAKGGRAYMDFRKPDDSVSKIGSEALQYLRNCGALQDTPIDRLSAINPAAVEFYLSRGIDLRKEPLEVAVCAQHCNGGIAVDEWWRTSVAGLYAVGECSGAFGRYRPGGSALNETQVGSLRAAQNILSHPKDPETPEEAALSAAADLARETAFLDAAGRGGYERLVSEQAETRAKMDAVAGAMRDIEGMRSLRSRVIRAQDACPVRGAGSFDPAKASFAVTARDTLAVQGEALSAMLLQAEYGGFAGHGFTDSRAIQDAPDAGEYAFETRSGEAAAVPLRPLPQGGGWFETVWRQYREGRVYGEE